MTQLNTDGPGWSSLSHLRGLLLALRREESKAEKASAAAEQRLGQALRALERIHAQRARVLGRIAELENRGPQV